MFSPDFALGALVGMTLWRVIYYFTASYKEQDAYKAGYDNGCEGVESREEQIWCMSNEIMRLRDRIARARGMLR